MHVHGPRGDDLQQQEGPLCRPLGAPLHRVEHPSHLACKHSREKTTRPSLMWPGGRCSTHGQALWLLPHSALCLSLLLGSFNSVWSLKNLKGDIKCGTHTASFFFFLIFHDIKFHDAIVAGINLNMTKTLNQLWATWRSFVSTDCLETPIRKRNDEPGLGLRPARSVCEDKVKNNLQNTGRASLQGKELPRNAGWGEAAFPRSTPGGRQAFPQEVSQELS